jgi:hypothetical protein
MTTAQRAQLVQLLKLYDPSDAAGYRARLVDGLERELKQDEQREISERLAGIEALLAKQAKTAAAEAEVERRSTMTPKRKSDLISEIGLRAYQQIPW